MSISGFFGAELDRLARTVGGWPDAVIIHTAEAISPVQVLLTGSEPCGVNDGEAVFAADAPDHRAVVSIDEYRLALKALADGALGAPSPGDSQAPGMNT
jgi:hypothetical protein